MTNKQSPVEEQPSGLKTLGQDKTIDSSLLDLAYEPMFVRDFSGRITYWNNAAASLYGYSQEEAHGADSHELLKTTFPVSLADFESSLKRDGVWTGKLSHITKFGKSITVESRQQLFKDADGKLIVLETNRDTTERDHLFRSRNNLANFVRYMPVTIAMLDRSLRYLAYSRRWLEDYHLGDQNLIGRHHYEVFPEILNMPEWQAVHQRVLAGETIRSDADRMERADGTVNWIKWEIRPWYDDSSAIGGILISSEDISARKQAEEALQTSEQRLKRVLETDAVGVLFFDVAGGGILIDANNAFLKMTGYTRTDVESRKMTWRTMTPPEWVKASEAQLEKFAATGRIGPYEKEYFCKDGSRRWMLFTGRDLGDGTVCEYAIDITIRKQAEEALKASEARYRTLFSSIDEGYCVIRLVFDDAGSPVDYVFEEINPSFERQTGIQNAVGRSMREIAPNHEVHWFETYGRIAMTGQPERFVNIARALGRWYDVYAFRIGEPNERRVAILFNDITARKKAEVALRESEQYNRMLFESLPIGLALCRMDGSLVDINPAFARIIGRSIPECLTLTYWDITPISYAEQEKAQLAELQKTGSYGPYEKEYIHSDGHRVPVSLNGLFVEKNDEKLIWSSVEDITERKEVEEALKESECRQRMVIEAAGAGLWSWDAVSNKSLWDNRYHTMYGFGPDTPRTFDTWISSLHPEDRPLVQERIRQLSSPHTPGGNDEWNMELRVINPDGEILWMHGLGRGERDAEGKLLRLQGINLDITARKQNERARERHIQLESVAQTQRLNAAGELAALLAHQINQPLTAIRSFAEAGLLRMKQGRIEPEKTRITLQDIVLQSERAASSIRDLRKFLARQPQEMQEGDLNAEILAACSLMETATRSKQIKLRHMLSDGIPRIPMRASQIEQVIINLMENAMDAINLTDAKERSLQISTHIDPLRKEAVTVIQDSGPGLTPELVSMVFDPLYTTKKNGIGMGLSISRSIIEEHGGRIWAEAGTHGLFAFSLPLST